MSEPITDLTPAVAAVWKMNFEGNIIPHTWYKSITYPNGKTDLNAIIILAEIVYWYRPRVERDETTGEITGIYKRFAADMLQRSYQSFADQFGLTKRQCQDAVARLVDAGRLRRELRTVKTAHGVASNVPFFEPVVEALQRDSYHVITGEGSHSNAIAPTPKRETYTENTYKTNAKKQKRPTQGRKGSYPNQSPRSGSFRPPADIDPLSH